MSCGFYLFSWESLLPKDPVSSYLVHVQLFFSWAVRLNVGTIYMFFLFWVFPACCHRSLQPSRPTAPPTLLPMKQMFPFYSCEDVEGGSTPLLFCHRSLLFDCATASCTVVFLSLRAEFPCIEGTLICNFLSCLPRFFSPKGEKSWLIGKATDVC